jgi:hypothetical protein
MYGTCLHVSNFFDKVNGFGYQYSDIEDSRCYAMCTFRSASSLSELGHISKQLSQASPPPDSISTLLNSVGSKSSNAIPLFNNDLRLTILSNPSLKRSQILYSSYTLYSFTAFILIQRSYYFQSFSLLSLFPVVQEFIAMEGNLFKY